MNIRNSSLRALLVLALACGAIAQAPCQSFVFKVVAASGGCTVSHSGKKKSPAHAGMQLGAKDKLTVPDNGYVGLIHASNRTLEVREPGTYSVSDLEKQVPKQQTAIASRLSKFMLAEMEQSNTPVTITDTHADNMGTTGSVERLSGGDQSATARAGSALQTLESRAHLNDGGALGKLGGTLNSNSAAAPNNASAAAHASGITVYRPHATSIIDSTITFSWNPLGARATYDFALVSGRGTPVVERKVNDTSLTVSLGGLNLATEECYYWTVKSVDDPSKKSEEQCIFVLSSETSHPILDTVKSFQAESGASKSALASIALASFYEDHNLLPRAEAEYLSAIRLAPGATEYRRLYASFLKRTGVTR